MIPSPSIFISYSWADTATINAIDKDLQKIGIHIKRDIRDIAYSDSIKEFMKRIRKEDFALLVLSEAYLKSKNCMFEVLEFIKDENYKERLLVIVLPNTNIFSPEGRVPYIMYWKEKRDALEQEIKALDIEAIASLSHDLKMYRDICNNMGEFLATIADKSWTPFETLQKSNYEPILKVIKFEDSKLAEKLLGIANIENEEDQDIASIDFINRHQQYALGYFAAGDIYRQRKKFKIAISYFNKSIELDPNFVRAYNNRGTSYAELKDFNNAIIDINEAIKLNPKDGRTYYNRGKIYDNLKDYKKAIKDYNQAIKFDLNFIFAYVNLGIVYRDLKDYDKAISNFNHAIRLDPNFAKAYFNRGITYRILKEYQKAIADSEKAIELEPKNATNYQNRGVLYVDLKEYQKAIVYFTKAIELEPKDATIYGNRGAAYIDLKKYQKAIIDYTKAIELEPPKPDTLYIAALYHIRGFAYAALNDNEKAEADFKKAKELNPRFRRP